LIAFVYIPVGLGAILCLEVMYRLPHRRRYVVALAGMAAIAAGGWLFWSLVGRPESDLLTPGWFQDILARLQLTEQRLLPSWWLSSGLLETARGAWTEGLLFLALMISNALFCRQVAVWRAARIYRRAFSRAASVGGFRKPIRRAWLDRGLNRLLARLPRPVRLLLIKDLRLFRRDPVQWSQFVILFALLVLYFLNVRRFSYSMYYAGWVSMVSFLNLAVVGLLMATFTTRFIFPMVSLETRRLWLLGMLPLRRETIVWSKFLFAVASLLFPCSLLVLTSDIVLRVSPAIVGTHLLTCALLCPGLSGIAVGLGARLPSLREESPSRIAAGFGGTLSLVLSTLYIVAVLLLTVLPCHFWLAVHAASRGALPSAQAAPLGAWIQIWLWGGSGASVLLAVLATAIPLRIGCRAFRRLEG
jgi:ABC-2 type transport system permease protein